MTEKLSQIILELDANKKRLADIDEENKVLNTNLKEKNNAQALAIVENRDAKKIGDEIVSLQTRIKGIQNARTQLIATIQDLDKQRGAIERAIGKNQAEFAKGEYLGVEAQIYSLLVEAAKCIPNLRKKRIEYLAALKKSGVASGAVNEEGHKIGILIDYLEREIPEQLGYFPRSLSVNGKAPTPDEVKRLIR